MAELLRAAIDDAGLSIREVARVLAGPEANDDQIEAWRRSLHKYLDGTVPSRPRALLIARALEKPDDYLVIPKVPKREALEVVLDELIELRRRVGALEARLQDQ